MSRIAPLAAECADAAQHALLEAVQTSLGQTGLGMLPDILGKARRAGIDFPRFAPRSAGPA